MNEAHPEADDLRPLILIVDDDEANLVVMQALLEPEYRVHTAPSGAEALRLLAPEAPDLVIADQRMPRMSGVELLEQIRERCPGAVRMILTAYTDLEAILDAISRGQVYRYVLKPWLTEEMRVTVRQAIDWRAVCQERTRLVRELARISQPPAAGSMELERVWQRALAAEKLAMVGKLAAEMCHDLVNTTQVVSAIADKLALGLLGETAASAGAERPAPASAEAAHTHGHCAERVAEMAATLRDMAAGARLPFSPQPEDVAALVRQTAAMLGHHPRAMRRRIVTNGAAQAMWMIDRRQILHLLVNLLRNAIDATPEGGEIRVGVHAHDGHLRIRVEDSGPGIPPDVRDRIFEPFFTTKAGGTGLGLSVCRSVADVHGGAIHVGSAEGGGARFDVELPLRPESG
jgi:signal transduction histidine kinase